MFKLIAPLSKKRPVSTNAQDSDSEPEDLSVARTSTPVKTITATSSRTTPVNRRNNSSRKSLRKSVVMLFIADYQQRPKRFSFQANGCL